MEGITDIHGHSRLLQFYHFPLREASQWNCTEASFHRGGNWGILDFRFGSHCAALGTKVEACGMILDQRVHSIKTLKLDLLIVMLVELVLYRTWELRINKYRVFYDVNVEENLVIIKAVARKEHNQLFIRDKEFEL